MKKVESLRPLIKESEGEVALETAGDRLAASQSLQKMLSTIIEFVKPGEGAPLSDDDLDAKLDRLIER